MISFVGFQVAAPATALLTWIRTNGDPLAIWLLATKTVNDRKSPERLKALLGPRAEVIVVSNSLDDRSHQPAAANVVSQKLAELSDVDVVFFADAGLGFQTTALSRKLPDGAILGHVDTAEGTLHCIQRIRGVVAASETLPLTNVGLDQLLALHELRAEPSSQVIPGSLLSAVAAVGEIPSRMSQSIRITGGPEPVDLALAYERHGHLYGLVALAEGEDSPVMIRRMQSLPTRLNGLRPVVAVFTTSTFARARLRHAGLQPLYEGGSGLHDWLLERPASTGSTVPLAVRYAPTSTPMVKMVAGAGGSGPPLAVWMGIDASATLASLWTHTPRDAMVLFDTGTPRVAANIDRLAAQAHLVPCGTLHLVPSDRLGISGLATLVAKTDDEQTVRVDTTPATRAQALAITGLPGAELWSLRAASGVAERIGTDTTVDLHVPPIDVQISVVGGLPSQVGATRPRLSERFLLELSAAIADRVVDPKQRTLVPLVSFDAGDRKVTVNGNHVTVTVGQTQVKQSIAVKHGFWFEDVVAQLLLRAGADEIRIGTKFPWPRDLHVTKPGSHLTELDVLARFGSHFFCASCKAVRGGWSQDARNTEAETGTYLGRFAMPLIIRPWLDPSMRANHEFPKSGAAFMDLRDMLDPDSLRARLDKIWKVRSTLG